MKYSELMSKFWKHNERSPLGSSAVSFYVFLIHHWYKNKCGQLILSDKEISKNLRLNVKTIRDSKKKLKDEKLIDYEVKIGYPSLYNIVTDISTLEIADKTKERKSAEKKIRRRDTSKEIIISKSSKIDIVDIIPLAIGAPAELAIKNNAEIPSYEEFISFAKTLRNYETVNDPKIKEKYDNWVKNGWNSGYNRPITNWKLTLKSTMAYIINTPKNENQIKDIPTINPPKLTNE